MEYVVIYFLWNTMFTLSQVEDLMENNPLKWRRSSAKTRITTVVSCLLFLMPLELYYMVKNNWQVAFIALILVAMLSGCNFTREMFKTDKKGNIEWYLDTEGIM